MPLFVAVSRKRERGARCPFGKGMPGRNNGGLETVLPFGDQIAHPCFVIQISRKKDIAYGMDRFRDISVERLEGEDHLLPGVCRVGQKTGGEIISESAHVKSDAPGHFVIGETRRSHAAHDFSQKGQVRLQVFGHMGDIKSKVNISNPVGEQVMLQDRHGREDLVLRRDGLHLPGNIRQSQFGKGCCSFR